MRPVALALATWALARPALTRIPALMGDAVLTGGLLTGALLAGSPALTGGAMVAAITGRPALTGGAILAAQEPSPYLPLGHWATPYVEHLIATGVIADPAPLTRPIREADLVRALRAVDTTAATASVRATVRRLLAELERGNGAPRYYLAGDAGAAVATHALRDPLEIGRGTPPRPKGASRAFATGGLALQLRLGPLVAVTHPYFDTRLKYDPDYFGKKDRFIAGRNGDAYLDARWSFGEICFGSLGRNWGPPALPGLILSPGPYSYDHLALTLGTARIQLQALLTQLDDLPDTSGTVNHRYLVVHRLLARPGGRTTLGLWEGNVAAGPGRTFEPWLANILNLGLLVEYDQNVQVNSLLGADFESRLGGVSLFGQLLIDDVQIDRKSQSDSEPPSYGLTLGARGAVRGIGWTAWYTRVANLTYRTSNPAETVERRFVGLGRSFSDYDQLTLSASVLPAAGLLLSPEATLVRQGEGDFRLPYPPPSAYGATPSILSGVVERTARLALGASWQRGAWGLAGNGGVHFTRNAGHVSGARDTRWVGSVSLSYRFHFEGTLP